ncbi:MAG: amino acid ABC transporter permease [Actinomycetota bacterium]|nr:amino acid ABC transporter permease [Actinomycetota bacterium]
MRRSPGIVIGDELGPRGRRTVAIASAVSVVVLVATAWVVYGRLQSKGQLAGRKWRFVTDARVRSFLLGGLVATLEVAAVAMILAMAIGALLALGRLAPQRAYRAVAGTVVEFFRAVPLLVLIFFVAHTFPQWGFDLPAFWYLVIALVAYNGAVLGEVFRAGILSLDRGQSEAAQALGMGWWQTMGLVVVPQAARRMTPAIVSQLVTLLKDSSLGFVLPYEELLRRGQVLGESFKQNKPFLQSIIVVAAMYMVVNILLSRFAHRLEVRQRRSTRGPDPMPVDSTALAVLE